MAIIKLSYFELNACWEFARKRMSNQHYSTRNQKNQAKIKMDIYFGACAEVAVFNHLRSRTKKIKAPDFNIYEVKNKSFEADLSYNEKQIHVKSCRKDSSFPISWVFQVEDEIKQDEFVALCVVDTENNCVDIQKVCRVSDLNFKDPLSPKLKGIKKVVYKKDLDKT